MTRHPLVGFDADIVSRVAADHGTTAEALATLVERHQQSVRELPGVDDIVYEWRNAFTENPVVERREDRYLLSVPAHVWPEFASALSLSEEELAALRAVHADQLRVDVDSGDGNTDFDDDPMVLVRP
ncbi:hypothetical protein AUR64_12010 [Haloprofundus marisrubri]|uniref:DUF8048 domain-containing protein n=1 Tax=Haloprofundus marisrubri TaxID=1514971 RepID=A0A0W1RAC4_9EURY|nr:hypothetical protein [Haloprofundus marisrubri]KTG10294.1 hypothetical protein AUR64_12010 [Haloprofundus marisrubri]